MRQNQIQQSFHRRVNSFERNHADGPMAVNAGALEVANLKGNPGFVAQFDVQFLLKYFELTDATGAFVAKTAAELLAAVPTSATQLAGFLYGNSDFAAGFKRVQQAFPLTGWTYSDPGIFGRDLFQINGAFITATVKAVLQRGDLVIPAFVDIGATTWVGLCIVRCTQVGYGTLLDSLNSDMFIQNLVRYIMADTTAVGLAQYNNNIVVMKQSLFGKFDQDQISPNSFKMPEQFQAGIIDVPIKKGVDKQTILASYFNYDAVLTQWSLFVQYLQKQTF